MRVVYARDDVAATAIGLGCMRLSTHSNRDEANGIAVIHAALDAGVRFLDTADVYCLDEGDTGHNERLIAKALRVWDGDAGNVEVATKGGMRRPEGAWIPDGRAVQLKAACEASRIALGVDVIDLYQLHVVDPRVPIQTSVRALAALQKDGRIRRVGLSNVNVTQIEIARDIVGIDSVQVPLSVVENEVLRNGVAEYCAEHGIRLIAYRPLGGAKRVKSLTRDETLARIANTHDATPQEVALAWLCDLGTDIVPIPGPTQPAHAAALPHASRIRFDAGERAELDERFRGRVLRVPRAKRRPPDDADGDVVMVMGMPGAGKSTVAEEFVAQGHARLNRDVHGGRLSDLVTELDAGLERGQRSWVLDNTYASRADRSDVIECAWRHGVPVRLVWLDTEVGDAQINAITRLITAHGALPMPEDLKARGRTDHRYFGPDAQFRYQREMEPPSEDEGFRVIEQRAFQRMVPHTGDKRAVFFDPNEVTPANIAALRNHRDAGWLLCGIAWRPSGEKRVLENLDYEYRECTHPAGPPICWCRKPLPGLLLEAALKHRIDLGNSVIVGDSAADKTMAGRLGMRVIQLADFT
ncbi:MAG TPA: aldo/keto reductase [Longimicrobiales bacterium]